MNVYEEAHNLSRAIKESEEYKHFLQKTREKAEKLKLEYPDLEL